MFTMEYKSGSIAENIRFEVLDGIGPVVLAEVRVGGSYAVASKLLSKETYNAAVTAALDEARARVLRRSCLMQLPRSRRSLSNPQSRDGGRNARWRQSRWKNSLMI